MSLVLPIAVADRMVGSGFVAGREGGRIAVATVLHILGNAQQNVQLIVPGHQGDCRKIQSYPVSTVPTIAATVACIDHFSDLAVLLCEATMPLAPEFVNSADELKIGEDVVVLGYPFDTIGSLLETWTPTAVTSLGRRMIAGGVGVREFTLDIQAHPGLSGSPVLRRADGVICGVVRGCLAHRIGISIGGVVPEQDTSITFAVSAHTIPEMVRHAFARLEETRE